jgi:hypothetical protein
MKLVLVGVLAALAVPIAAGAAGQSQDWSATLTGRIVEEYGYTQAIRDSDCTVTRIGHTRREVVVRSLRPTALRVEEVGTRVRYRPSSVGRVSVRTVAGGGGWSETLRCRGGPIERRDGTCEAAPASRRVERVAFRRAGTNRIAFRSRGASPVALCGAGRAVRSDTWLHVAPGRVDEVMLASGRRARVVARGATTLDRNVVEEPQFTVGQNARITWTLAFRRR